MRHRGHLAELERAFAIGRQRLAAAGQGVEGVPSFVEQGPHVGVEPDGVHEDERQPRVLERRLIAAGGLPLAVGQVEQVCSAAGRRTVRRARRSTSRKMVSVPSASCSTSLNG